MEYTRIDVQNFQNPLEENNTSNDVTADIDSGDFEPRLTQNAILKVSSATKFNRILLLPGIQIDSHSNIFGIYNNYRRERRGVNEKWY